MSRFPAMALLFCFALTLRAAEAPLDLPGSTPWDLKTLGSAPGFDWIDSKSAVRSLKYSGERYHGHATKVFAYFATPGTLAGDATLTSDASKDSKLPGVVLVHGGGGTAFKEWAELWARRGYAAIAMDLAGKNVGEEGGPDQDDQTKLGSIAEPVTEHWPYHAVANVIRAHSLLRSFAFVDPDRTAITGISWGGYLTCIAASIDSRFKAAVPVYGCGFLHENSYWLEPRFEKMKPEDRARWVELYDPSRYLACCRVPILFMNGTNDFAYPLDSYMKSYGLVRGAKNISVTVNMPHGHTQGWAPKEIGVFIDQQLLGTRPLLALGKTRLEAGLASVELDPKFPPRAASLHFTADAGPINKRSWTTKSARLEPQRASAELPGGAAAWFFTAGDDRDAVVSSGVTIEK